MDAFSNFGSDMEQAISGQVTKGFFVITSYATGAGMQGDGLDEEDYLRTVKVEDELEKELEKNQKAILKKAAAILEKDDGTTSFTGNAKTFRAEDAKEAASNTLIYEVQYNPSTFTIKTKGSGVRRDKAYGALADTLLNDREIHTQTDLSMTLIFEAINNFDAFSNASDSLSLSGDLIGRGMSAANSVASVVGGNDSGLVNYSVREQVMGFLSLMTKTSWRDITFYYGKTSFHGMLTSVRPVYKMFNSKGDPIYAEVSITITQDTSRAMDDKIYEDSFLKIVDYEAP